MNKKFLLAGSVFFLLSGCIQNYSNEYKEEAQRVCTCMEQRRSIRSSNIPKNAQFIKDDEDYTFCLVDAKIKMIDTKGKEFTAAIIGECPALKEIQERYLKSL